MKFLGCGHEVRLQDQLRVHPGTGGVYRKDLVSTGHEGTVSTVVSDGGGTGVHLCRSSVSHGGGCRGRGDLLRAFFEPFQHADLSGGGHSLVVYALIYFFFLLGMQPAENTLVATYTPRRFHSLAYGAKFELTFGVGVLSVKMEEAIQAGHDIETVFFTLSGISVVLVCVILFPIRWSSKQDRQDNVSD